MREYNPPVQIQSSELKDGAVKAAPAPSRNLQLRALFLRGGVRLADVNLWQCLT
jgi:hypothetical protein